MCLSLDVGISMRVTRRRTSSTHETDQAPRPGSKARLQGQARRPGSEPAPNPTHETDQAPSEERRARSQPQTQPTPEARLGASPEPNPHPRPGSVTWARTQPTPEVRLGATSAEALSMAQGRVRPSVPLPSVATQGAREQGSKGAREQGSKGAREQGSKGALA